MRTLVGGGQRRAAKAFPERSCRLPQGDTLLLCQPDNCVQRSGLNHTQLTVEPTLAGCRVSSSESCPRVRELATDEEPLVLQRSYRQAGSRAAQGEDTRWHQRQAGASHRGLRSRPRGRESLVGTGDPAPRLGRGYWRYWQPCGRHQIRGVRVLRFLKSPGWREATPGAGTSAP